MKKLWVVFFAVLLATGASVAQSGVKKMRPLPRDYGKVVINNYSEKAQLAPVVFDHWLHRAEYTCRVCHVDVGFAMTANETKIRAADNASGNYCGACHNGKMTHGGEKIFAACSVKSSPKDTQSCIRCHSLDQNVSLKNEFAAFTEKFPKKRFGNGVDWIEAEAAGLIKLTDSLDGVPVKNTAFKNPKDSTIAPKTQGMPDIIFSHDKHGVWNGCELCHPEVFPSVQKGQAAKYSMNDIFDGKYCGVCHTKVSFPMTECQRCHSKPVLSN